MTTHSTTSPEGPTMKITARAARYLTGRRPLTPADVDAERCALYGPCSTQDCPSCGGPRPAPVSCIPGCPEHLPAAPLRRAIEVITDRERIRNELDSCEDFGVDPRFL